jgi:hypothetical protein
MVAIVVPVFLQLALIFVLFIRSSCGEFYQRCRSTVLAYRNDTANLTESSSSSLLRDLQEHSVCAMCEDYQGPKQNPFDHEEDDEFKSYNDDNENGDYDGSTDDDEADEPSRLHVVIMVGSSPCLERVLILASGLLAMDVHVTLVIENKSHLTGEAIFNAFMQHIPCHDDSDPVNVSTTAISVVGSRRTGSRRRSQPKNVNALLERLRFILLTTKNHCEEDLACHVSNAQTVLEALVPHERMIVSADVAIVDGVFVAGMLMAEAHKIPALYLMETPAVYASFLSFLHPSVVVASPARWWSQVGALLRHRWKSLDFPFAALNRIRTRAFGLARIRELSDLWQAGIILVPYSNNHVNWISHRHSDPVLVINGTYLPPCIPCDYQLHQQRASVIREGGESFPYVIVYVSFASTLQGRNAMRNVIRAISMVRSSLVPCNATKGDQGPQGQQPSHEATENCWNYTKPLEVVMLGRQLDLLFPPYVHLTTTSVLDALAAYGPAVAIVAPCDESNSVWKYALGPPVICVHRRGGVRLHQSPSAPSPHDPQSSVWNHRRGGPPAIDVEQLAIQILRAVTQPSPPPPPTSDENHSNSSASISTLSGMDSNDALVQVVRVAQLLAAHKAERSGEWANGRDVKRSMVKALFHPSSSRPPPRGGAASSATELALAWAVLGLSATYLLLASLDTPGRRGWAIAIGQAVRRLHHHPRTVHHNGSATGTPSSSTLRAATATTLSQIRSRLRELERVWRMWRQWGAEVWAQMQDTDPSRGTAGIAGASRGQDPTHGLLAIDDREAVGGTRSSVHSRRRFTKSKRQ